MAPDDPSRVRISTSKIIFQCAKSSISEWLRKRLDADSRGQHKTQLSAIETVFSSILEELERDRARLANVEKGIVYENCGRFDRPTVWLERLLQFFRQRFDQREDREYGRSVDSAPGYLHD